MKKTFLNLFILTVVLCASCKKDDNSTTPISTTTVNNTVISGTWRVSYYWDKDHDETLDFSGYAFTFGSGNILTAAKTGSTISGTWTTGTDDSEIKLILNFLTTPAFVQISDDWHVTERTDTRIKLEDISGGSGGTDYLTFEKN